MKLYFAYGMNLNRNHMKRICPTAIPKSSMGIIGYRIVMRRYADLVEDPLCSVWGGIWEIDEECEKQLDQFEGFPRCYRKIEVQGATMRCLVSDNPRNYFENYPNHTKIVEGPKMMTYQMNPDYYSDQKPSLGYIESIIEGLRHFGMPPGALSQNLGIERLNLNEICEVY